MLDDIEVEPTGWQAAPIMRHRGATSLPENDPVAQEWPVALTFNGISHAVMMATPRDLEAFAVGFALTEGIVRQGSEIRDIEVRHFADVPQPYAEIRLSIVEGAFAGLKQKRRSMAGRSGCGVCGIESIELLELRPEPILDSSFPGSLATDAIARAARELPAHQPLMRATGGVHAAAWCNAQGAIDRAFEDVGRHNALDKLLGDLVLRRQNPAAGFVFLSSRASYELVRKAARLGVPMLATISAPSSLAINVARQAGIRLVSFCRETGFVEYQA